MTGTFRSALEARDINTKDGKLTAEAVGDVHLVGKVLVIRSITVTYTLRGVEEEQKETVERVHGFHAGYCPVARSIRDAIDVTTKVEYAA
ncbi:MAG: OsmC family protein [Acidimicrobiia bacterium]